LDISASFTPQISIGDISAGPPDPAKFQIWLQLNGSIFTGIFFYAGSVAGWITTPPVLTPGIITNNLLAANSVGTSNLQSGSVTGAKLANGLPLSVLTPGGERQTITTQNGVVAWRPTIVQSPNLSWANVITWTHGIGAVPNYVRVVYVCISDGDPLGYSLGDEVDATGGAGYTSSDSGTLSDYAANIMCNSTVVNVLRLTTLIKNAAASARGTPNPGFWQVKIYAGII
jgi:hypothetical protein